MITLALVSSENAGQTDVQSDQSLTADMILPLRKAIASAEKDYMAVQTDLQNSCLHLVQ